MTAYQLVLLLIFVVLLAAVLVVFLLPNRNRSRAGSPADRQFPDPLSHEDDRYWYGGVFYYNPDDPDPVVPRRFGFGWTVNVGHPLGKVFIAIMIAMILLPLLLAILDPGLSSSGCHPSNCHLLP